MVVSDCGCSHCGDSSHPFTTISAPRHANNPVVWLLPCPAHDARHVVKVTTTMVVMVTTMVAMVTTMVATKNALFIVHETLQRDRSCWVKKTAAVIVRNHQ